MRNFPTECEKILWYRLRNSQLGVKFDRQYSVGGYVLDFFCPKERVAIEVDGDIHDKADVKTYDEFRTRWLKSADIRMIRVKNGELKGDLELVLQNIKKFVDSPLKVRGEIKRGVI